MRIFRAAGGIAVATVAVVVLLKAGAVKFVADAYPADPFRSDALAKCTAFDPNFIRFLPDERALCYSRLHVS